MQEQIGGVKMIQAWHEMIRDQKDHVYFAFHKGKDFHFGRQYVLPAIHKAIEIAFVTKGEIEIVVNNNSHVFHAGEICFINSFETHRYYYNDDVECYVVLISASYFSQSNRWGKLSFPSHMEYRDGFAVLKRYLDHALVAWDANSQLCKHAFSDTLSYLMTKYYPFVVKDQGEKQKATLMDAVIYVCEHYAERITAEKVAARFGYSVNYFSHAFKSFMGMSFSDYLKICRLTEFYRLRDEHPELSVASIAEKCGFESMNTFYRSLKSLREFSRNIIGESEARET